MVNVEAIMHQIKSEINESDITLSQKHLLSKYYDRRIEECRNQKEIVIFGSGHYGKTLYNYLRQERITSVVCFCDNNKEQQGKKIFDLEILSLEQVCHMYPNAYYLVTPKGYENEILRQLILNNIPIEKISIIIMDYFLR